jgi:hypothetical protein
MTGSASKTVGRRRLPTRRLSRSDREIPWFPLVCRGRNGIRAEAQRTEEGGGRYRWVLAWYDGPADLPRLGDKAAELGLDTRRFSVARVIIGPALVVTAARIAVRGDLPRYPDPARLAEAITAEARSTDHPGQAASSTEKSLAAQLAGIAGDTADPATVAAAALGHLAAGRSLWQHRAEIPASQAHGPAGRHHGGPGGTRRPGPSRGGHRDHAGLARRRAQPGSRDRADRAGTDRGGPGRRRDLGPDRRRHGRSQPADRAETPRRPVPPPPPSTSSGHRRAREGLTPGAEKRPAERHRGRI